MYFIRTPQQQKNIAGSIQEQVLFCLEEYQHFFFKLETEFLERQRNCENRLLASSCPSVRLYGTIRFQLDGFS